MLRRFAAALLVLSAGFFASLPPQPITAQPPRAVADKNSPAKGSQPKLKVHYRRPTIRAHVQGTVYNPPAVARRYDFPNNVTGKGATVGVIELGGKYNPSDLTTYMAGLGLPVPTVNVKLVDGASPVSDGPNGADGEVMLDIEVIASIAPGSVINVYFADNSTPAFLDAFKQARADGCLIVSCSWGGPENTWSPADIQSFNSEFQAGSAAGVNYFVAAGDNGSGDGESGLHVDFPGSSPYVVCCGGTSLPGSGAETVWNDGTGGGATGGGISTVFARPTWQPAALGANRCVPDIAGDADPNTGYATLVDGMSGVIGGTSAVAPLYAAYAALVWESKGKSPGFLLPQLYAIEAPYSGGFIDITTGSNGAYTSGPGYDECSGIGRIDGAKLLATLSGGQPPVVPPPPPVVVTPPASALFTLTFARAYKPGQRVTFTAPVAIPVGSYSVNPQTSAAHAIAE